MYRYSALVLGLVLVSGSALAQETLVSVKTDQTPTIDGVVDTPWQDAPSLKVTVDKQSYKPSNGYKGITKTTVAMKSLYDQEYVYFLVQYDDPTLSVERYPWVKQPDGTWKQSQNKDSTGHENTYYEDKMAIIWDINTQRFNTKGCAIACHKARGGRIAGVKDKAPGRKYTNKPGETLDMWHWKAVRSDPVAQVDDQYIDSIKDPKKNSNWGRHGDAKTGGGYQNNVKKDKTGPMFMNNAMTAENKYWVLSPLKTEFVDNFKPGDVVPGIVVAPFQGSRGDIEAKGVWRDGVWTIELKRKLVTTGEKAKVQDVQFNDLKKTYNFGVSVFDNSQINHVYHEGVYRLMFK